MPHIDPQFHGLIPALSGDERAQLEANILEEGIRDALVVWAEEDVILDGHNRYEIAVEHELPYAITELSFASRREAMRWVLRNQLGRRNLSPMAMSALRGQLYNDAKRQGARTDLTSDQTDQKSVDTSEHIASEFGVSAPTIRRDGQFAEALDTLEEVLGPEARQEALSKETKLSKKDVQRLAAMAPESLESVWETAKTEGARKAYRDLAQQQCQEAPPLPTSTYRAIIIDPPWQIQKILRDARPNQAVMDYPMMDIDEISALPIAELADAAGCHIYLWTTHKYLPEAFRIFEAWGVKYQCLMTWVKNVGFTPFSWMYSTEHVLFGRIGSLALLRNGMRLDFAAKVREHSRKPVEFYDVVREASPGPRLDMFAREPHEGFETWGNEVERWDTSTISALNADSPE